MEVAERQTLYLTVLRALTDKTGGKDAESTHYVSSFSSDQHIPINRVSSRQTKWLKTKSFLELQGRPSLETLASFQTFCSKNCDIVNTEQNFGCSITSMKEFLCLNDLDV